MKLMDIINALALPPESTVDQRVPKKLLIENGAPTAADKRQINDGIEEFLWLAALKPTTIGVPEYRDSVREYLEIAVLSLTLRPEAKAPRLIELVHRAVPYPVLLFTVWDSNLSLSLAHKRFSQNEAGKVVLEDFIVECPVIQHAETPAFLASLTLTSQPRTHLLALYQGWIECAEAFQAAQITGRFVPAGNDEAASSRRAALAEYDRFQREIDTLRTRAAKELQINRRVELNLGIKRLEAALAEAAKNL